MTDHRFLIPEWRKRTTPRLLKATRGARIDLLFTMSDITHAGQSQGVRICVPANEIKAQHQAAGAVWWSQTGSNRRPPACKAGALPTELWPPRQRNIDVRIARLPSRSSRRPASPAFATLRRGNFHSLRERRLVGLGRFELPTSRLSSARSNQLSYKPEPGVSDQKPVIRKTAHLITDHRLLTADRSARSRRKRNGDGGVLQMGLPILKSACPDVSKRSDRGA
jgi:hypothetical protein